MADNTNKLNEDNIIEALDSMMGAGVSRLKIDISEELNEGEREKKYHHGRCDVGSPFATGKLYDFEGECE